MIFVEYSRAAAELLRQSLATLGADAGTVVEGDACDYLESAAAAPADIVFLDPPYAAAMLPDLCRLLSEHGWLHGETLIYAEHDRGEADPGLPQTWQPLKNKTAGNVRYLLLKASAAD